MKKNGFTIIELIISLALIGIIVSLYARIAKPEWAVSLNQAGEPYMIYVATVLCPLLSYDCVRDAKKSQEKSEGVAALFNYSRAAFWLGLLVFGWYYEVFRGINA